MSNFYNLNLPVVISPAKITEVVGCHLSSQYEALLEEEYDISLRNKAIYFSLTLDGLMLVDKDRASQLIRNHLNIQGLITLIEKAKSLEPMGETGTLGTSIGYIHPSLKRIRDLFDKTIDFLQKCDQSRAITGVK